ncbi:MAG: carbohydrate kinase family protein, partial [Chlorobi bacterium]|nr:carbohydrate kinase family protein [Chlorobiota bacterium]
IYHTINTLVNIKEESDEIYLATLIPKENYEMYSPVYNKVNLDYSTTTESIPIVTLGLFDDKERHECYHKAADKITLSSQIDYKQFDGILINMISGYDIDTDDLSFIREQSKCRIYFDVHTLARGYNIEGERKFKQIENVERWLENIDIIQMNQNEMWMLFGKIDKTELIEKIFSLGVEIVIITKGEKGVEMYSGNGDEISIDALKVNAVNVVGCGDAFGTSFLYKLTETDNPSTALKFANTAAGLTTTYKSLKEYKKLKNDIGKQLN